MNYPDIRHIISLSEKVAERILLIYRQPTFDVSLKLDNSLLTKADLESHTILCEELKKHYPSIPVISEESTEFHHYSSRMNWKTFFLIDPLDGTKEFVNRNDEFTVNIALIHNGQPVLGVINAPALNIIYYAERDKGAYKIIQDKKIKLAPKTTGNQDNVRVVISRSHACQKTEAFLAKLQNQGQQVTTISAGSALKFGLIAEGRADIYPRFTPTMEWDTAAGHVLINEVGKTIKIIDTQELLQYNKMDLTNSGFIVQ